MFANELPLTLASTVQPSKVDSVVKLLKSCRKRLPPAVTAGMVRIWSETVAMSLVKTEFGAELEEVDTVVH